MKAKQVNVREFGPVADGETDDTAAIQRAIDAAREGETVVFLPGIYRMSGELKVGNRDIRVVGAMEER